LDDYFVHVDESTDVIKDMYTYDPDKAKQMLADAGYPDGFTSMVTVSSAGVYVDEVAILKSMWEKVGVILELDVKEAGSFRTISNYRKHEEMIYAGIGGTSQLWPRGFGNLHSGVGFNLSYIDEPYIMDAVARYHVAWLEGNEAERIRISREEVIKPVIEEAWAVGMPASRTVTFWWPWIIGYDGQSAGAFQSFPSQYLWIDQELKKEMGY
ncbi:ABC transporter substrate-binding protein, partial [Chloroflexota bacterium]